MLWFLSAKQYNTSIHPNVHFVNFGPINSETGDEAGCTLGHGYLVKTLPSVSSQ